MVNRLKALKASSMGFFSSHVLPSLLQMFARITIPLSLFPFLGCGVGMSSAPIEGLAQVPLNPAANKSLPRLPGALGNMVGSWKLQEKINVDQFMAGLGINRAKRVRRVRLEPSTSRPAHPATHAPEPHCGTGGAPSCRAGV